MNEQQQLFERRLEQAVSEIRQQAAIARHRERCAIAALAVTCLVALTGWTLNAQQPKTIVQRVEDLEKRTSGFGIQGDDGVTRFKAPFLVVDSQGQGILSVDGTRDGQITVRVGDPSSGGLFLGADSKRDGYLGIDGANGNTRLSLDVATGFRLLAPNGNAVEASIGLDQANRGHLEIGQGDAGGVAIGAGGSGAGHMIVRDADGSDGTGIGRPMGRPMGVYVFGPDGKSLQASLYGDKLGGNVRVMNPQGVPVGGLFSEEEGGGLVLTGPAGGHSVVDLGVRAGGGSVRVSSEGGSTTRAALEADDRTGGVTAYNNEGRPAVTLTSRPGGSGYIQILQNGTPMVEAGVSTDGVGVVRALPGGGPGGALGIPHQIVGFKSRK